MRKCHKKGKTVRCLVVRAFEANCATERKPGMVIEISPLRFKLLSAEGIVKKI